MHKKPPPSLPPASSVPLYSTMRLQDSCTCSRARCGSSNGILSCNETNGFRVDEISGPMLSQWPGSYNKWRRMHSMHHLVFYRHSCCLSKLHPSRWNIPMQFAQVGEFRRFCPYALQTRLAAVSRSFVCPLLFLSVWRKNLL